MGAPPQIQLWEAPAYPLRARNFHYPSSNFEANECPTIIYLSVHACTGGAPACIPLQAPRARVRGKGPPFYIIADAEDLIPPIRIEGRGNLSVERRGSILPPITISIKRVFQQNAIGCDRSESIFLSPLSGKAVWFINHPSACSPTPHKGPTASCFCRQAGFQ